MFRLQTVILFLTILSATSYGQDQKTTERFKYGSLKSATSLLHRRFSNPLWQNTKFKGKYYLLVQLNQIATEREKTILSNSGIVLEQYVSGTVYLASLSENNNLQDFPSAGIHNLFVIPTSLKMKAGLKNQMLDAKGPNDLIALTCFPVNKIAVDEVLKNAGIQVIITKIKPANTWFLRGSYESIEKLARLPFVISLAAIHLEDIVLNYNNRAIHGVHALSANPGRNLYGKNIVVGIGDNADPSTHIDLSGKLIMRTDEPVSDHGTFTSGIIAGGGILNPMYMGMAPRVKLVVNDFSNILVNSPTYVSDYNMVLTNNSYYNGTAGCAGEGEYNALSNFADQQLIAYPALMHVFAAGNDGGFTCTPYPLHFGTIKSGFQTAKNVLTIGSMNNVDYSIGANSSRGPALDGRIKPELVAGGVGIISTISNNGYTSSTGTSLSSPTVTGILALITERYKQLHGGANPDGALIKTLVMNNADDLGNPGPDFTFGFGMINGRTTVEALEQNRYFTGTISNGTSQQFTIPSLPSGGYQLKIMLYWPDPPAVSISGQALINDLDLTVTTPSGITHFPMVLDTIPTNVNNNATEGQDHTNNIEQVLVNNPVAGNYTITVNGNAIPSGPQPFYITYTFLPQSVTMEYPFGTESLIPAQNETIRWSAYGGDPNTFTLDYSTDGGSSWNLIDNAIPSTARSYPWIVPSVVTNNALMRITRNSLGFTDQSDYPFTILGQPDLTGVNTCSGYVQLNWNSIAGAGSYDIMKLSGDTMQLISNTTDTSFLVTPLNKDSSYWFAVRAVNGGYAGRRSLAVNMIPNSGPCTTSGLDNDLIIDSLSVPSTGRQFTSTQPGIQRITLAVRNPGNIPTTGPVSFNYSVNGGPAVNEIFPGVIAAHGNLQYTFLPANSYDFSAAGLYQIKTWIHYASDTIPENDTLVTFVKNLRNDPLILNPSFTESFESATDQSYTIPQTGLDSLDRADFSNSNAYGRLNSFFNSGFARTGNRSILLDVSNQGNFAADSLTTTFNLSNYTSSDQIWLNLYFKKQSTITALPGNQIWIRGNDQSAWIPVKKLNDPLDPPGTYIKLSLDLTGILASAIPAQTISSSFQVRCGAEGNTPATSSNPLALQGGGISFDDFIFTNAKDDLGMLALVQPSLRNICAFSNAEKITVLIKNFGTDTLTLFPVTYAINQDTVTEIIPLLAPKDSLLYTFNQTADLSAYQLYHIKTWVSSPVDNYRNNDSTQDYIIQTTPMVTQFPYLEGFENNNGYWYTGGVNSSWQWGKPSKKIIHKAANGTNAWVTSLNGNYNDNEFSYLYSPCFDLSSLTKPVLSFSHIFRTEDDCHCDFHWVEYSLDDSSWITLGNSIAGVNWYDASSPEAWQMSDPVWHVSSYDIPVNATKVRFRIVMFSDPGANFEGVGIDDIHVFDKAPVFSDSTLLNLALPVNGNGWIDFDQNGQRMLSINPHGQDLGNTQLSLYRDTLAIRDTASQYYSGRNWVLHSANTVAGDVGLRFYFTDSEANQLIHASGCASCLNMEDAYSSGITEYSSSKISEEDSSLKNNRMGSYQFFVPQQNVQVIPYDNGYYAEITAKGFSEFWINAGAKNKDHPLAAWLKDFTVVLQNNTGLLNWTTWQENGTVKFVVEKSADSALFYRIGEVSSKPHTDSIQGYTFSDTSLLNGNNYYRLVLYFQNGDSLVSPVQKIIYSPVPSILLVYPNPTYGNIFVNTPSECHEIQIFDITGRKILEKACSGYFQQLSLAPFSTGVYLLKLYTNEGIKLIKLEKR